MSSNWSASSDQIDRFDAREALSVEIRAACASIGVPLESMDSQASITTPFAWVGAIWGDMALTDAKGGYGPNRRKPRIWPH